MRLSLLIKSNMFAFNVSISASANWSKFFASYVDTTDFDYICPECASDESSEINSDNEECDKCGYLGHPDDFVVSKVKFGTLEKLLFLIQRRLDKIQICFIKK